MHILARSIAFLLIFALILTSIPALAASDPVSRLVTLPSGEALRVTTLGTGEPVILIPGLFGSAYGFRKVMPGLADGGWQAIVIEPLGVGGSGRPADADYSLTAQADRIAATLHALGIERAIVVAHSVGASMAYRLAYRHPDRVTALVSIEGGVAESAATPGFRRAMRFAPLIKLFGKGFVRGKIRGQLAAGSADPAWVTDEVVDGYTGGALADLGGTIKAYQRMAKSAEPEALTPRLGDVRCPVRLLLGAARHDGGPSLSDVELLTQKVPNIEVERVPASGHFIFEEAPAAVVAAVARAAKDDEARRTAVAGGKP
jgi:pimeloyl-ACP methyl ester carboxylesterase